MNPFFHNMADFAEQLAKHVPAERARDVRSEENGLASDVWTPRHEHLLEHVLEALVRREFRIAQDVQALKLGAKAEINTL